MYIKSEIPEEIQPDVTKNAGDNAYSSVPKDKNIYENDNARITEGFWSDSDGNQVTRLDPNERAYAYVQTEGILPGETVQFYVYDWDGMWDPDDYLFSMTGVVDDNGEVLAQIDGHLDLYDTFEDISELYFEVKFNGKYKGSFPSDTNDYLKCMIVGEVPHIMGNKGWTMGQRYMDYWFQGDSNADADKKAVYGPSAGLGTMEWLLQWPRAREAYDALLNKTEKWTEQKGQDAIRSEIRKMNRDGWLRWPAVGGSSQFGTTSRRMIEQKGEQMPLYHSYYFNRDLYEQPTDGEFELDDFYASYGNFNFILTPFGTITRIDEKTIRVRLERIGVHTWDQFDFSGLQYLGHWSFSEQDVKTRTADIWISTVPTEIFGYKSYHYVENEDFNAWRDEYGKGGDFSIFSDVRLEEIEPVEFEMTID